MITQEIAEFINQKGQPILFGTRDASNQPHVGRAVAAIASKDSKSITILVPDSFILDHPENLKNNGRIALTISNPYTHLTYQLKGKYATHYDSSPEELFIAGENFKAFSEFVLSVFGEELKRAMESKPVNSFVSIKFDAEEIFDQTPGPKAGKKINELT